MNELKAGKDFTHCDKGQCDRCSDSQRNKCEKEVNLKTDKRTIKFRTQRAAQLYKSWDPIIEEAKAAGVVQATIDLMNQAKQSWIGK